MLSITSREGQCGQAVLRTDLPFVHLSNAESANESDFGSRPAEDTATARVANLVQLIQSGIPSAESELYAFLRLRFSSFLRSQVPEEYEDIIHEAYLAFLSKIREKSVRSPETALGLFLIILKRRKFGRFREKNKVTLTDVELSDLPHTSAAPEVEQIFRLNAVQQGFERLSPRDREILDRFYRLGQPKEQIMVEMGLTATQFRLFKCRAKSKLIAEVQKQQSLRALRKTISGKKDTPTSLFSI